MGEGQKNLKMNKKLKDVNMEEFASMASGSAEASRMQADMLKQIEAGNRCTQNV